MYVHHQSYTYTPHTVLGKQKSSSIIIALGLCRVQPSQHGTRLLDERELASPFEFHEICFFSLDSFKRIGDNYAFFVLLCLPT